MRPLLLSLAIAFAARFFVAMAAEEPSDPQAGFEYAKGVCSVCHGISARSRPCQRRCAFGKWPTGLAVTGTALRGVDGDFAPDHA